MRATRCERAGGAAQDDDLIIVVAVIIGTASSLPHSWIAADRQYPLFSRANPGRARARRFRSPFLLSFVARALHLSPELFLRYILVVARDQNSSDTMT